VGLVFARKGNKERDGGGGIVGLVVVGLVFERKENNKRDGVCTRN
jgi:hypothetical protein